MYPIYKAAKWLLTDSAQAKADKEIEKRIKSLKKTHGAEVAAEARDIVDISTGVKKKISRRKFMRNVLIGGATLGVGVAAADVAIDASKDAADKRVDAVVEEFSAWQKKFMKTAFDLYDDFGKLVGLLMKLDTWKTVGQHTLTGLADDVIDFVRSGDTDPDKIEQSFTDILEKNPEIKKVYEDIQKHVKELRTLVKDFGEIVSESTDHEVQKERFLNDFEESFKRELKDRTIGN